MQRSPARYPDGLALLTQNSELHSERIWNWSLPAWVVQTSHGKVNVCPQAGACAKVCYARNGTYLFPVVMAAHLRNLEMVLGDLEGWKDEMVCELGLRRFWRRLRPRLPGLDRSHLPRRIATLLDNGAACVRIHDAGDFLNTEYLLAWLEIADLTPEVIFYTYTKEVAAFKTHVEGSAPVNFLWCYSTGGKQDHLIDKDRDRHADVFPSEAQIAAAGYTSQGDSDLLSVLSPHHRIGIPANRIPAFNRRLAGRTFSELEGAIPRRSRGGTVDPGPQITLRNTVLT